MIPSPRLTTLVLLRERCLPLGACPGDCASANQARAAMEIRLAVQVLAPNPTSFSQYKRRSKMDPTRPLVIHELLLSEIMGVLFEEHAKLEWRAPAIDGRVCRIWREIVLNIPRAWIYLDISDREPPRIQTRIQELREWLNRSGSAPLYIHVNRKWVHNAYPVDYGLYDLLGSYHTRIASLRLPSGDPSFFNEREFPCLQLLDITRWCSVGPISRPVNHKDFTAAVG